MVLLLLGDEEGDNDERVTVADTLTHSCDGLSRLAAP